ncbi:hypothetical protein PFAS1_11385 [Pseudomonas frederiksbergensis]|jgi:hypothetical protein|nr:hypothetical protein PFAS1_11385 [Pseudomonas frederiksbergensis]
MVWGSLADIAQSTDVGKVCSGKVKKPLSAWEITLEKGLLKGNTATSGTKAAQYMETDRSGRDGSHPPGVPITVGLKS